MRKLITLMLLAVACVGLASCSDTLASEEPKDPTEEGGNDNKEYTVKFKVDIRVPELKEEVLNAKDEGDELAVFCEKFYNDLIGNKSAIPNDYTLTFKKGEEVVGEYNGTWGETEIALQNGTYQVTGECAGDFNTASFSFDESITIDKNTSVLTLNPRFNCWIFLFDRQGFSNAWWCNGETPGELVYLNKTDEFFYVFSSTSIPKLPFVLGDAANCNNLHEQIEYSEDNIWHLGLTWQDEDKNYPEKVWYCKISMHIDCLYYCNKEGHIDYAFFKYILQ